MPPFRRVADHRAGPRALGILVPPGRRTLVILRPRALAWDLLPLRAGDATALCDFGRDEAAALAREVQRALEQAACGGVNPVEAVAAHDRYRVCVRAAGHVWLACPRVPGQPYQPLCFATLADAHDAAGQLATVLWPAADAEQEYYFNTQNFSR